MADPNNEYPDAVQFMRSPMFVGLAVAFISHLVAMFGKHISDEAARTFVDNATYCVTAGGLIYAGYKRWRSKIQPLTLTSAKAADLSSQAVVAAPLVKPPENPT